MTHDELLAKISGEDAFHSSGMPKDWNKDLVTPLRVALRAVVELHKPEMLHRGYEQCTECGYPSQYPCETIQAIEKELK